MQKHTIETTVGFFIFLGIIVLGYLTVKLGDLSLPGNGSYSLFASFTSVTGLREGSPVYIMGLEVGKTGKLTMDQESQRVIVELRMKKGIKVYDDAIASIKTEGLIGDKSLILDPGGGGDLLHPGETITETHPPVEIADIISRYAFGNIQEERP